MKFLHLTFLAFLLFLCFAGAAQPQTMAPSTELKRLSLEQLLEMEVTTASRKPQHLSTTVGAIDVLNSERIQRSAAMTLPDLLRSAAGLHVVRSDGRSWGISARGLNLNTANKLQVLMDGRILYTPLFSGVFWDVQDYVFQDISRIEVIRGPGATLWGGNAVNGVINILTRSSEETQGTFVEAGGGTEERAFVSARHGSRMGDSAFYRGYFKFFARDALALQNGQDAEDDWWMGRGGFRMDGRRSETDTWTLQGDIYHGELAFADRDDGEVSGGNVIGRWSRLFRENNHLQIQVYYDRSDRRIPLQFAETRNTFDIDLQHHYRFHSRHDLVWGFNYRASADSTEDIGTVQFEPFDRTIHHFSGFIQDDISIVPQKVIAIVGTKLEDNTFSGLELQPNLKVAWMPDAKQTIWAGVSRAVRVPARLDTDLRFFPVPGLLAIAGNPDFRPEELLAFEIGYRIALHSKILFDASPFFHSYDSLITLEPGLPGQPATIGNGMNAETSGLSFRTHADPYSWLRLTGSITFLHKDLELDADSRDLSNAAGEGNDPDHFWQMQAMIDPREDIQLDFILRSSGELPSPVVPGYVELDLRFAWFPQKNLELSLTAQNLVHDQHPEFGAPNPDRREVQRGVYGKFAWFF